MQKMVYNFLKYLSLYIVKLINILIALNMPGFTPESQFSAENNGRALYALETVVLNDSVAAHHAESIGAVVMEIAVFDGEAEAVHFLDVKECAIRNFRKRILQREFNNGLENRNAHGRWKEFFHFFQRSFFRNDFDPGDLIFRKDGEHVRSHQAHGHIVFQESGAEAVGSQNADDVRGNLLVKRQQRPMLSRLPVWNSRWAAAPNRPKK